MRIVESPSSIGYSEEDKRAIYRSFAISIGLFIGMKILLTYIIHKATHHE